MTRDEITALEGRELDAQVAEQVCEMRKAKESSHWLDATGHRVCGCAMVLPLSYDTPPCPFPLRYSTDLNACREAELAFHGTGPDLDGGRAARLMRWYREIRQQVSPVFAMSPYDEWELANADAATRCRAMLLALEEGR